MTSNEAANPRLRVVLAATDLSESAAVGIEWAAALAADHGARLLLVHALGLTTWSLEHVSITAEVQEQLQMAARSRLQRLAADIGGEGLEVDWLVEIGQPFEVVSRVAAEVEADLVVIGSRGLRGFESLLVGSTARKVVQRCDSPVLTVHPGDILRARPVRRILAATDFSPEADAAARASLALLGSDAEGARIDLLHAYHVPYEFSMDTAYGSAAAAVQLSQNVAQEVRGRLERSAKKLRSGGVTVEPILIEGDPRKVIGEHAEALDVDLISMGTRGRTGLAHALLGSTAELVIQRAPRPVLSMRRSGARRRRARRQ